MSMRDEDYPWSPYEIEPQPIVSGTLNQPFLKTEPLPNILPPGDKTILDRAAEAVNGARAEDYGAPERNISLIAKYWSLHLGHEVSSADVCQMMILLKLARLKNSPGHEDSLVDVCGYAFLNTKLHEEENNEQS